MYLRRNRRTKDESDYEYWSLVESVRTARGPRQRTVATIGKRPGIDHEERVGWEEIRRILDGKPMPQTGLLEHGEAPPSWATVDITRVNVERLRHFDDIYLGLLLWSKLGFAEFCKEHMPEGKEDIPTIRLRVVATASSALKVLIQRMKILLPNRPRTIKNVVAKIDPLPS